MKIKFVWQGTEHEVEVEEGRTLLDAALIAGINPPYSCMEGHCGTCEAAINDGSIVRTCQTLPRSDITFVNYDRILRRTIR